MSERLTNERAMLERVERVSAEGWTLDGVPVEEWADNAVREGEAVAYLARKIAVAEGLELRTQALADRMMEIEDEAHQWVKDAYTQAEAREMAAARS